MTLAELRRLVTNYSGRTDPDFLTNVDDFIRLGHRYVERAWQGRESMFSVFVQTVPMAAGVGSVPVPAAYRPSAGLNVHLYPPNDLGTRAIDLIRIPLEAFTTDAPWRLPDGTTIDAFDRWTRGTPRVYCFHGRQVVVRPVNAEAQTIAITATGWAEPLRYDADETVVSQAAGEAVLYAALREAWSFLGDPAQKATWEAEATRAIEAWMRDGTQDDLHQHGLPLVMQVPG
jgi:hypothetical protein